MNLESGRMLALNAVGGIALAVSFFPWGQSSVYLSIACGSVFALGTMVDSLRNRQLDVNLLMVLAAIGSIIVGQPREAAVLLFLFSLSSALEELALSKTEGAIASMIHLQPKTATRLDGEAEIEVPVESLALGDTVRLNPFSVVPVDGELLGEGSFNESAISGESQPVHKMSGDLVMAGTQNLSTRTEMRVNAVAGNTTLDRIVRLVQEAKDRPNSGERISRWFAASYTIFVLAVSILSFLIRFFLLKETAATAGYQSLILLVALSPCALVISAPAASLSALAFAARRGILVRGGLALEQAGLITAVNLDKTGTLTSGKFGVTEVCLLQPPVVECWRPGSPSSPKVAEAVALLAGAETASQHPIAVAILNFARDLGVTPSTPEKVEVVPGQGVLAEIANREVKVGQMSFFSEAEVGAELRQHAIEMGEHGLSVVVLAAGEVQCAVGLRDTPRPESASLVRQLRKLGVKSIRMLTGDNHRTAQAVAKEVGIHEVDAGLSPADKHAIVQQQVGAGEVVLMVGDGVNDAPALATAQVGVAMGGLGNEVALEVADIVLVQDRIERLPLLIALGRKTLANIRGNLWFAGTVIVVLTVGSLFGWVPLSWAVIGHEGSTALVVLNGLRLLSGGGATRLVE